MPQTVNLVVKNSATGDPVELTGADGKLDVTAGSAYGTYPEYNGLPISYSIPAAATIVISNVQSYHFGELAISIAGTDTLLIQARYADGVTVGTLDAVGPTGAAVVLSAAQLVAANSGRYRLNRFDAVDLIITKTGAGACTVIGRLGSA